MTRTAYEVVYYHDEPDDANTDSTSVWPISTLAEAKAVAKRPPSERWNGGASIHRGEYDPGEFGIRPPSFDSDIEYRPWYVYDGKVER